MKSKSNTRTILDILASKLSLLILGGITLWLGYLAAEEMHERYKVKLEITRLKEEIVTLEKKNNDLSSLINSFEDPAIIELEAKKRLNLKKPGEEVAVIVGGNDDGANINITDNREAEIISSETSQEKKENEEPNVLKWWRYIVE